MPAAERPVVLSIAGADPTSGAGIQADLLTCAALGAHACTVVSAITVQDTQRVHQFVALPPELVLAQARAVLNDMPVAAIKLGMLGSAALAWALAELLAAYPQIPLVLDPILRGGGGGRLADTDLPQALLGLLPHCTVITPNSEEARCLGASEDLSICAKRLLAAGAQQVLISGGHEAGERLENQLFDREGQMRLFSQQRLAGQYHGSGCTLASAIAVGLARGQTPADAVAMALDYTHRAISAAYQVGSGQRIPDRLGGLDLTCADNTIARST